MCVWHCTYITGMLSVVIKALSFVEEDADTQLQFYLPIAEKLCSEKSSLKIYMLLLFGVVMYVSSSKQYI